MTVSQNDSKLKLSKIKATQNKSKRAFSARPFVNNDPLVF
jgi:hypothetical protein